MNAICAAIQGLVAVAASGLAAAAESPPPPVENSLDTVVVQGQKLNVESRIDRKIYSVPDEAQSELGTLSDILSGQRYQRVTATPLFTQVYRRSVEGRVAFIGVIYSFGVTKKEKESNFEYDSGGG